MKKHVALLHYAYPPNISGVELLVQEHAHILTYLGYQILVLTGYGEEKKSTIHLVSIPHLQSLRKRNLALYEKILEKNLIDEEFYVDVEIIYKELENNLQRVETVIIHNMLTLTLNIPFIVAMKKYIQKNPDKKFITWIHDHPYIKFGRIIKDQIIFPPFIHDLITKKIEGVTYVAISDKLQPLLTEVMELKSEDICVIPNGINMTEYLEVDSSIRPIIDKLNLLYRFPIILSPVNLLDRKNIEYSLEVVAEMKNYYPDLSYIITGSTSYHKQDSEYYQMILKKIHDLDIKENVIFLHNDLQRFLSQSELRDFYKICDCVFYLSKSENFGLPLLEAALSNKPIFVSDLEIFREVGKDYLHYIDYENTSPRAAATVIRDILNTDHTVQFNRRVKQQYDLLTIIKKYLVPLL